MNHPARRSFGLRFWLVTLLALAIVVATALLGRWQLSRAAQMRAIQAAIDERQAMSPLHEADLLHARADGDAALLHYRVRLRGQWLPEATVFLDNRQMQGRPGFFVLTPLRLEASQEVVLVQRGWVARDFQERTHLPAIAMPAGEVQVEGRLAGPPARLFEFQPSGGGQGSSRIRQNLDLAAYGAETGLDLLPLTVVQTGNASDGLRRDWAPIDSGVEKHYGYAFQWFGLCGLVVVLYVWFQLVRRFFFPGRQRRA
ncbi:MAG: SURF1 family protein [Proteobacteria bacterium]|nr:SURF1 family protein [Pseudomonadota bacterium]